MAGHVLLCLFQALSDITKFGSEVHVNTITVSAQGECAVTGLVSGGYVVAYQSDGNHDGDSYGVYAQEYDMLGNKFGTEVLVNQGTDLGQQKPVVVGLGTGGYATVFQTDVSGSGYEIHAVLSTNPSVEFKVNTNTQHSQVNPSVALYDGFKFVVVWASDIQDGNGFEIRGQLFGVTGTKIGTEFPVNTHQPNEQVDPFVASLNDTGFVVTWASRDQDGDSYGIYAQLFDPSGAKDGTEFKVNQVTAGSQTAPRAAGLFNNNIVIAWTGTDGSSLGVFGIILDAAGVVLFPEFQINTGTAGIQQRPSLAPLVGGGFFVVWEDYTKDASNFGVAGRTYTSSGVAEQIDFVVNTYETDQQVNTCAATLSPGIIVVGWESYNQNGDDNMGVFIQMYMDSATQAPSTNAPPTATPTTAPATNAPLTATPTSAPATNAPLTATPTSAPVTNAPLTDAPATNAPATIAPDTNVPATDVPATDIPATASPPTDAPATTAPATDAPQTAAPGTLSPLTPWPVTLVPATKSPPVSATQGSTPSVVSSESKDAASTTAVVTTGVSVTSMAVSSSVMSKGSSRASKAIMYLKMLDCPREGVEEMDILLSPTRLKVGSDDLRELRGAAVGNLSLLLALFLVLAGLVVYKRPRGGVETVPMNMLFMMIEFLWLPTMQSGFALLFYGSKEDIVGGAVVAAAGCVFLVYVGRMAKRASRKMMMEEKPQTGWRWLLLPTAEWCGGDEDVWYVASIFDGFQQAHCNYFIVQLCMLTLVSCLSAWNPEGTVDCASRVGVLTGVPLFWTAVLIKDWPFLRHIENIMEVLVSLVEFAFAALAYYGLSRNSTATLEIAGNLALVLVYLVTLKFLVDLITAVACYFKGTGPPLSFQEMDTVLLPETPTVQPQKNSCFLKQDLPERGSFVL
eukprot:TRINITY_DN18446_c0_g1_i1.p1 TRINITY_DN18446_c0_g1~~TRINITY_DN18446_c0_g1_i1.p1  ORF type:complete len:908 (+),score=163.09 TRINITY_DN18446_c0_g1_i1:757-3480(+)